MKYIKNPVEVEALQFTGSNYEEIVSFTKGNAVHTVKRGGAATGAPHPQLYEKLTITTIHQGQTVDLVPGDYVIPESDGTHFYPCKPDVFEKTYRPFVESADNAEPGESSFPYLISEKQGQGIRMKSLGINLAEQTFEQAVNAVIFLAGEYKGQLLELKKQQPKLVVQFQGPFPVDDDQKSWIAVIENIGCLTEGKTKAEAFQELIKSISVKIAYDSGISATELTYLLRKPGVAKFVDKLRELNPHKEYTDGTKTGKDGDWLQYNCSLMWEKCCNVAAEELPKFTEQRALHLFAEGEHVLLEIEVRKGEWVTLMKERLDSAFGHIIEPLGIESKINNHKPEHNE